EQLRPSRSAGSDWSRASAAATTISQNTSPASKRPNESSCVSPQVNKARLGGLAPWGVAGAMHAKIERCKLPRAPRVRLRYRRTRMQTAFAAPLNKPANLSAPFRVGRPLIFLSDGDALRRSRPMCSVELPVAFFDAASPLVPGKRGADMVRASALACRGDFLLRHAGCQRQNPIAEV